MLFPINTYLVTLLITLLSILLISALKPKFIDEDMHHFTIYAYFVEWNDTIIRDEKHFNLIHSSPVHFWLRCIDKEVRGYFTFESLMHYQYSREPAELAYNLGLLKERFRLYADDTKIEYRAGYGGADFKVNVTHKPLDSSLYISIHGWKHYNYFPMSKCMKSSSNPNINKNKEPAYIMNVVTPDPFRGKKAYWRALQGFAKHIVYHTCALDLVSYEIVIHEDHFPDFTNHPDLKKLIKIGLLSLLIKPRSASRLQEGGYWFQAIYQNLAILRHWRENIRLALWDQDEYINFNHSMNIQQFKSFVLQYDSIAFPRWMVFCYDCPKDKPEVRSLSFAKHRYKIASKLNDPKVIVNPDTAGCFRVHWDMCGPGTFEVSNETAFILHFENLLISRWQFTKDELSAMSTLNSKNPPLLACDPIKLFNFTDIHMKKIHNL